MIWITVGHPSVTPPGPLRARASSASFWGSIGIAEASEAAAAVARHLTLAARHGALVAVGEQLLDDALCRPVTALGVAAAEGVARSRVQACLGAELVQRLAELQSTVARLADRAFVAGDDHAA